MLLGSMDLNLRQFQDLIRPDTAKNQDHFVWIHSDLVGMADEFIDSNIFAMSSFTKIMNGAFRTDCFGLLTRKWTVEHLAKMFDIFMACESGQETPLIFEDNPLYRFGAEKYRRRFGRCPSIKWKKQRGPVWRVFRVFTHVLVAFAAGLSKGLKITGKRKKYKVMREALWGLYDTGGHYFHDDFMVDGKKIKKDDIVLFSRGILEAGRIKAREDARKSPYAYFDLPRLRMGIGPFFLRVIPKYIFAGSRALFSVIKSEHFSLLSDNLLYFTVKAIPYERIFSNFDVGAELGHRFSSPCHIAEAIVCGNHAARYYLMHWSDTAIRIGNYITAHLGCDDYLLWGKAHITGVEGGKHVPRFTGYPFKKFISNVRLEKDRILTELGVADRGKVVSFFDESFAYKCNMTPEHYVNFWEAILNFAKKNEDVVVLVKPKTLERYKNLPDGPKMDFLKLKSEVESLPNTYIVDDWKWSFIEVIGVSDCVITQGMTSSATIAIICGIEGLYFDEAGDNHPFRDMFKDRIVFDESGELLKMIGKIIKGEESPLKDIPEAVMREFDAHDDDAGLERLISALVGDGK